MLDKSQIRLINSDNQKLTIDIKSCEKSKLLKNILIDYEKEEDFPLSGIDSETLKYIIEYLEHYKNREQFQLKNHLKIMILKSIRKTTLRFRIYFKNYQKNLYIN